MVTPQIIGLGQSATTPTTITAPAKAGAKAPALGTVAKAIKDAVAVAGIKGPDLRAEAAEAIAKNLPHILHLAADCFLLQRDLPGTTFLDAMEMAVEDRKASLRYYRVREDSTELLNDFLSFLGEYRSRLDCRLDALLDEANNRAPMAKLARQEQGPECELFREYAALCAEMHELRGELAIIDAHPDLMKYRDMSELQDSRPGVLLLWQKFVGER